MKASPIAFALIALAAAAAPGLTAQGRSAEARLQAAVHAELVEGDLERAQRLYRELAADRSASRAVAATALVNLGRTYEKLGNAQARRAYERVVSEYADQVEPVRLARSRLQTLAAGRNGAPAERNPTYTLVLNDLRPYQSERFRQFDLSPDGERVVVSTLRTREDSAEGRRIYIADRTGTLMRPLPPESDPVRFRDMPRWSPDGRHIAYLAWRRRPAPDTGWMRSLVVAPVAGGAPRLLTLDRPIGARDLGWAADSRSISLFGPGGTHVVDLEGRTVRFVDYVRLPFSRRTGGNSPDGRWIALDVRNEGIERETDLYLVPSQGGREIQLTNRPGIDAHPAWSADGRALYYISDRSGSLNVWKLGIDPETGASRGEPEQITFYRDADVMHPVARDGARRILFGVVPLNTAIYVATTSNPNERRAVARGRHPQLSPDGGTVYYIGEGTGEPGIYAVPAAGGTPRRVTDLAPRHNYLRPFHLSPDGRNLAFFSPAADSTALYVVPTQGGEPRRLLDLPGREDLAPDWSPDGTRLAYARGDGLYVIRATGGAPTRIATLHQWEAWTARWSPDGRWISALGYPAAGTENTAYVVPAEGGEPRAVTPREEDEYKEGLEWHPDGTRLSYMYYPGGGGDGSRLAYLDGRPTASLVNQPAPLWDYLGRWDPAGRKYYFISTPAGQNNWGLYAHDQATGQTANVSPGAEGTAGLPSFSRDGSVMTWTIRRQTYQLWMLETGR